MEITDHQYKKHIPFKSKKIQDYIKHVKNNNLLQVLIFP